MNSRTLIRLAVVASLAAGLAFAALKSYDTSPAPDAAAAARRAAIRKATARVRGERARITHAGEAEEQKAKTIDDVTAGRFEAVEADAARLRAGVAAASASAKALGPDGESPTTRSVVTAAGADGDYGPTLQALYKGAAQALVDTETRRGVAASDSVLAAWRRALPDSVTRHVAEAEYRVQQAWAARSGRVASLVPASDMAMFETRIQQAGAALERGAAIRDAPVDPKLLSLTIVVGMASNAPRADMDAVIDIAVEKCPAFTPVFEAMSAYLQTRWHGDPGDMEKYAESLRRRMPRPHGDIAYARVAAKMMRSEGDIFKNTRLRWPAVRDSLETLLETWPKADETRRDLCRLAALAGDRETAARHFGVLGDRWNRVSYGAFSDEGTTLRWAKAYARSAGPAKPTPRR